MFQIKKECYESLLLIKNDRYENILENLYTNILRPSDIAIDIGAHIGRHTFPMANAVGDAGKIYAFEPIPNLYRRLNKLICVKNLEKPIKILPFALSDIEGNAEFLFIEDEPGLSGLKERSSHKGHTIKKIEVNVKILDRIIPFGEEIKFIKIDAEGADFFILKGAKSILLKDRPLVVFESGRINAFPANSYNYSEKEFKDFFLSIEYALYDIAGLKYCDEFWDIPSLNDLVAIPIEKEEQLREILIMSVLKEFSLQSFVQRK